MRHLTLPLIAGLAVLLTACATATPYQPLAREGATRGGYAEQLVEPDRLRVTFAGNSLTSREDVELGMLHRAAELTLARGYDWFEFAERRTDVTRTVSWPVGSGRFGAQGVHGRWSHGWAGRHHAAAWGGLHGPTAFDVQWESRDSFTAAGEIVMRRGEKPAENIRAFAAQAILSNVGPRLRRPAPSQ